MGDQENVFHGPPGGPAPGPCHGTQRACAAPCGALVSPRPAADRGARGQTSSGPAPQGVRGAPAPGGCGTGPAARSGSACWSLRPLGTPSPDEPVPVSPRADIAGEGGPPEPQAAAACGLTASGIISRPGPDLPDDRPTDAGDRRGQGDAGAGAAWGRAAGAGDVASALIFVT